MNQNLSIQPIRFRAARTGCLAVVFASAASLALGSGTQVGFKDALATARGDAFVATADNPSAIFYNPAGLTQLDGSQVYANIFDVSVASHYTGAAGSTSMSDEYHAIPSFYTTWKEPGSPAAYGIGIYAPFGLSTDWSNTSPLRTLALRNVQKLITYNFSAAWEFNPMLSVGVGITYNRASTDLRRGIGVFGPNDLFRFEGRGSAIGYDIGIQWKPSAQNSFAVTYKGSNSIKLKGTSDTIPLISGEPADATFLFPEWIMAGWSFRPTPQWNIEADLDYTNWNKLGTVVINKASGNTPLPFNWESGFFYQVGATRYFDSGWHVSGGICYTQNSTPDSTYTPAVPDSNRTLYCTGVGYKTARFSADFAFQYGDGGTRTVTGSPPSLIGATADGSYRNSITAFSLSLGLRF